MLTMCKTMKITATLLLIAALPALSFAQQEPTPREQREREVLERRKLREREIEEAQREDDYYERLHGLDK